MTARLRDGLVYTAVVLALVLLPPGGRATAASDRFTALAVNMTGRNTGSSTRLDIEVDRWSSDSDRDRLAIVGDTDGMTAVAGLLHDGQRIGFVRRPGQIGNDITFARDLPAVDGGHRILIVLARVMSAAEITGASPTEDYPFTVIELRLDPRGAGSGTMTVGAKVRFHRGDDRIDTEKYSGGTIQLRDVKIEP